MVPSIGPKVNLSLSLAMMAHTGHQGDQVERRVRQHMLALGNPASGQGRGCGDTVTRAAEQFLTALGVAASSAPVFGIRMNTIKFLHDSSVCCSAQPSPQPRRVGMLILSHPESEI